ncbi:hypothetical protein B0H11DRAFT_1912869 [Mycena galericulata]|nr:hypothetical protein B0H11DRAFT_1912869 [Mycena galericulata]
MAAVGGSVGGNKWWQSDTHAHPVLGLGFSALAAVYLFGWRQCGGHKAFLGGSWRHWRQCGRQGWAAVLAALQFEGGSMAAVSSVTWRQCDVGGGNLPKWRQLVGGSDTLRLRLVGCNAAKPADSVATMLHLTTVSQCQIRSKSRQRVWFAVDPRRGNRVGKLDASQLATFEARFRADHTTNLLSTSFSANAMRCLRDGCRGHQFGSRMASDRFSRLQIFHRAWQSRIKGILTAPTGLSRGSSSEEEQETSEAQDAEISTEANPTTHKYETRHSIKESSPALNDLIHMGGIQGVTWRQCDKKCRQLPLNMAAAEATVSTNIRCFAAQRGRQQREFAENKNDYTPTGWTIFYLELNFKPCAGELKKEKNSTEALDRGIEAGYSELMLSLTIEFHPSKIEYRVMYTTVHYVPGREEPTRGWRRAAC